MRVAICFAGLPRFKTEYLESWKSKIIDRYQAKVFVHSWYGEYQNSDQLRYDLGKVIQPDLMICEHSRKFDVSHYRDRVWPHRSKPQNVISMWYSINQSFKLANKWAAHHNTAWDVMIRARWDWWFEDIELFVPEAIIVPDSPGLSGHNFTWLGGSHCGHNDQFGFGRPEHMKYYADTYHAIPELYHNQDVDFCSELLLTANLIRYNIPVDFNYMNFKFGI